MKLRLALMLLSDSLLALAALCTAVAMRFGLVALQQEWLQGKMLQTTLIFATVSLFASYLMELYSLARGNSKREVFIKCLQCGCASFFFMSVVYCLHPNPILSKGVLFVYIIIFCLYQSMWHIVSTSGTYKSNFTKKVLILGTDQLAKELGDMVVASNLFDLVGYICSSTDKELRETETVPWSDTALGRIVDMHGDLLTTARKEKAHIVVVALPERRGVLQLQEIMQCKLNGIEVLDAASFYEILQGKLMLEHITPNWIIFSSGLRSTALVNLLKRCIDILLSLTGLILTAPFFPLIALVVKLNVPGPLFFKQVRVGDSEKSFLLYRFRLISGDTEHGSHADITVKGGTLAAPLVHFLRRSGIEGLPQLFNVLRGDMSFVGPRPEGPEFVDMLKKDIYYYSKRHTIKPGLTGWAQIRHPHGSSVNDAVEKLRYDLYYIKNISMSLDSLIMFEAVKVALFGRGRQ